MYLLRIFYLCLRKLQQENEVMRFLSVFLAFFLISFSVKSQTTRDVAVELFTSWEDGKGLKLQWKSDPNAKRYEVYTRSSSGIGWDLKDTFGASVLSYLDTTMKKGMVREYRVAKWHNKYSGFAGNGYITAGYEIAQRSLGKVLIAIDSSYSVALSKEISEYLDQLTREGWQCVSKSFLRTDSVTRIKAWVKNQYMSDTAGVKALILLGRIPVPYSGNFRPDAHPEHTGAWPADLYYGSFSIKWTDVSVNNTSAARSNNHNTPGDGKFDLSRFNTSATSPTAAQRVELPVGRIDLYDMGSFSTNDTVLVARYIRKNLAFRRGDFRPINRGLIDDNFGYFNSEAFASGGFRNFSVHAADSVFERDYLSSMRKASYLWSYGCGSGYYTGASGVASSSDFVTDSLLNPFTLTFGSYYGDWDNADNFLRAPLASRGWGLVSVWSGRPYWLMHTTALGQPMYTAVLNTYNSYPNYNTASQYSGVHIALMGDPTLKVYPVPALKEVKVINTCSLENKSLVQWKSTGADADSILIDLLDAKHQWIHFKTVAAVDTLFSLNFDTGRYTISVRPKKLMSSSSGSWWDLGAREIRSFMVNPLPVISLNYSKSLYCYGDSMKIADDVRKGTPKRQWQWAVGNKMLITDSTGRWTGIAKNVGRVDVFLTVTSDSGCTSTLVDSILIKPLPTINILGDTAVCSGSNLLFEFENHGANQIDSVYWFLGSTEMSQNDTFNYTAVNAGAFKLSLIAKDNYGCIARDTQDFIIKPTPNKPQISVIQQAIFRGDTLVLKATADGNQIQWSTNQSDLTILQQDSIFTVVIPDGTSSYSLEISAKAFNNGCVSDTARRSWILEYNSILDLVTKNVTIRTLEVGKYRIVISGMDNVYSVELLSLTGAEILKSTTWIPDGKNAYLDIFCDENQSLKLLVVRDKSGVIIATKKLF